MERKNERMPLQNDVSPIKEFQDQTNQNWLQAQIREQMCLETLFRYEFPILDGFGQSGLQRKKIQTAISMQLLR